MAEPRKQDIKFVGTGKLAKALGISEERGRDIEARVIRLIDGGANMQSLLEELNDGTMTDAERTSTVFSLGYLQGIQGL